MPSDPPDEFVEYAKAAFEHRECRAKAALELDGDATTVDPADPSIPSWPCGHSGVRYWLVPVKDGTP